jgi:AraC-like DNA-binding protein
MTYYHRQVVAITKEVYSNIYLTRQVIIARHFIDTHFSSPITLDNICKNACISKYHFLRSFKKLYGRTPYQHLTSIRIQHAKTLLKKDLPVLEVCFSVGFDSSTSFTALFKKLVGVTPVSFKNTARKKSNFQELA